MLIICCKLGAVGSAISNLHSVRSQLSILFFQERMQDFLKCRGVKDGLANGNIAGETRYEIPDQKIFVCGKIGRFFLPRSAFAFSDVYSVEIMPIKTLFLRIPPSLRI